jgi:hypothetical protein
VVDKALIDRHEIRGWHIKTYEDYEGAFTIEVKSPDLPHWVMKLLRSAIIRAIKKEISVHQQA